MSSSPDSRTKKITFLKSGIVLILIAGVGFGSYTLGYRNGAAELLIPPTYAGLINVRSTGDPALALSDPGTTIDFGDFWKTWNILDKNFAPTSTTSASTSTSQERVAGAIQGLVSSYNDPYTVFIPKEKAAVFKEQVNGEFQGIGAVLTIFEGALVVTGVLPDSPAKKAGITAGDNIISVDGVTTIGVDLNTVISHIRGPKDTTVSLTILRGKSQKESTITVTRGNVVIPTTATRVFSAAKSVVAAAAAKASAAASALSGGTDAKAAEAEKEKAAQAAKQTFFVLQLATFAKSSTDAFISELQKFSKSDTRYLIIDLRNNPGGYLDVANDLASYFLPAGALVVTEKTGAASQVTEHRSKGYSLLGDMSTSSRRIVVLLNRNSASASEILAGALQDHHVAKVVGETSFGKGSVQTLVDISNLGTLKITIARWYTPSGKNISHTGVTPDIVVNAQDPKYASSTDAFMDAAAETLLDDAQWK